MDSNDNLIASEAIKRRQMILFFMVDTSGSMYGAKIASVNDAIKNVLPIVGDISRNNADAEIMVSVLTFSSKVEWLYDEPKSAEDFIWQDMEADGLTRFGEACKVLNEKLSRKSGYMKNLTGSGYYTPAIILLSDGEPTDVYENALQELKGNSWFKSSIKCAIAIGNDADTDMLKEFTGTSESVITVHNIEALKSIIKLIAITSSTIGSQSKSASDKSKQDAVNEKIKQGSNQIDGVALSSQSSSSNDDDWD
ncbi:MAG TPA: hypothetical protein DDY68_04525 [Porphyromonadaceae bacterium]|nr:hypothetical protein [Porphyromonadaceae bacterium]